MNNIGLFNQISNNFNKSVLLRLMQLFSANSPLGNFNYSHGLEAAVNYGWINSTSDFIVWEKELMDSQLVYLDLPMIRRFYYCSQYGTKDRFLYYLDKLLSFRETYELRMEEQDRGAIIVDLISRLGLSLDNSWSVMLKKSILASIAWIGCMWGIPLEILCLGYAYSNLENNIVTGLKLVPFGQFAAQKILIDLSDLLPGILQRSNLVTDRELGSSFPFQGIVSSYHEIQHARLFRS